VARSRVLPESLLDRFKWEVDLAGAKDGVNLSYTAPDKFLEQTIRVYRNGHRLRRGTGCDYEVSESGGVGSGFDAVTLLHGPLVSYEQLFADYVVDV
jgi:hypothetical protein